MQIISSFATFLCLLINLGQESKFPLIIKTYVALSIIVTFDNRFAASLPKEIKDNAKLLLASKKLKIGHDHNSFVQIWNKLTTHDRIWRIDAWF